VKGPWFFLANIGSGSWQATPIYGAACAAALIRGILEDKKRSPEADRRTERARRSMRQQ
jgi:hypothetical protein